MKRKLTLFGHKARMNDKGKIKTVMLSEMEGAKRRGRSCREWLDDIKEWCEEDIGHLRKAVQDRNKWKEMVKCAFDTYRLYAHGQ